MDALFSAPPLETLSTPPKTPALSALPPSCMATLPLYRIVTFADPPFEIVRSPSRMSGASCRLT